MTKIQQLFKAREYALIMQKLIPATSLASYLYCPRKLYLEKVIGLVEINKEAVTKGSIRHYCYELINKNEEEIIKSILTKDRDEIYFIFKKKYFEFLKSAIEKYKQDLISLGISPEEFFEETNKYMINEAFDRSLAVFNFINKTGLFGEKLWKSFEPKHISELKIEAKELGVRGVIDQIEVYGKNLVPFELKTGKAPSDGVWPGHRMQLGVYILMLEWEKGKKISYGYINYLDQNKKSIVLMNPFLRMEIFELIEKVKKLLASENLPKKVEQIGKCNACALKQRCWQLKDGIKKEDALIQIKTTTK
ncbi:MAG: CRISPR-associated protein Cas4 [Candidatus Woesearchaeota archaeon]